MRHTARWPNLQSLVVATSLSVAACGSAPDLAKELDTVRSWTATVELAASERRAGATTLTYTKRLFGNGVDALAQSRRALAEAARSDTERAQARAVTDSLAAALRSHIRDTLIP
jgi:hypothetical protein